MTGKLSRSRGSLFVWLSRAVLLTCLILLWDAVVRSGRVSELLLPRPGGVVGRLWELFGSAELWSSLWVTVYCVVASFVISLVIGVGLGAVIGASKYWTSVVEPLVVAAYTVPIIVILPVITLLFGIGDSSKIAFAGIYGMLPMLANTIRGVRLVPPSLLDAGRALGSTPRQLKWHVQLPAARVLIMAGVRIGLTMNLIGVIAAQMLASTNGIGFLISTNAQLLNAKDLYAYILIAFALAGTVNFLLVRQERGSAGRGQVGKG